MGTSHVLRQAQALVSHLPWILGCLSSHCAGASESQRPAPKYHESTDAQAAIARPDGAVSTSPTRCSSSAHDPS